MGSGSENFSDSQSATNEGISTSVLSNNSQGRGTGRSRGRPPRKNIAVNEKPKSFYFHIKADIKLLNYVLQTNPFEDSKAWAGIVENLVNDGYNCSIRQCKDRLNVLMGLFKQQNMEYINKTGTEKWNERTELISEVIACKETASEKPKVPKTPVHTTANNNTNNGSSLDDEIHLPTERHASRDERYQAAALLADVILESPQQGDDTKKRKHWDAIEDAVYSKARLDHDLAMAKLQAEIDDKNRAWEMEEKKIKLEERRLNLDEEERKTKLKLEEKKLDLEAEDRKRQAELAEAMNARQAQSQSDFVNMNRQLMELMSAFVKKITDN